MDKNLQAIYWVTLMGIGISLMIGTLHSTQSPSAMQSSTTHILTSKLHLPRPRLTSAIMTDDDLTSSNLSGADITGAAIASAEQLESCRSLHRPSCMTG